MSDVEKEVLAMREAIKAMPVERLSLKRNKHSPKVLYRPAKEHTPFSTNKLESNTDIKALRGQVSACLNAERKKLNALITKKSTGGSDVSYALTDLGEALVHEYHDYLVHELVTRASKKGFRWITNVEAAVLLQHEGDFDEKSAPKIGINGIINNDSRIIDAAIEEIASLPSTTHLPTPSRTHIPTFPCILCGNFNQFGGGSSSGVCVCVCVCVYVRGGVNCALVSSLQKIQLSSGCLRFRLFRAPYYIFRCGGCQPISAAYHHAMAAVV